jgi:CheY-like chemotaxis protein
MIEQAGKPQRAVLVVDDDAAIREVVRQALESEGWRVLEAADGAAALTAYERDAPGVALVLLDLSMPTMNGAQFAERYRRLDGKAPLVVFTATHGMEAAIQADRLRAVGFVTKPFELDELLAVVARCARAQAIGQEGADRAPSLPAAQTAQVSVAGTKLDSTGVVPRLSEKVTREELEQQRQMDRLRKQLAQVQEDMGRVRLGVTEVTQIELQRRLTREEARRASQLRMESERLRYELQVIRDEFFRLKDERRRNS